MPLLTQAMVDLIERQRLAFIATVCPDGTPNVSPKGTLCAWGTDHLVFADIRSPGTIANLRTNPAVEVNVVNPFVRKGYRFKGQACIVEEGPAFEQFVTFFAERGLFDAPRRIRVIVVIRVERATPLLSPGYDHQTDEAAVRKQWTAYYKQSMAIEE